MWNAKALEDDSLMKFTRIGGAGGGGGASAPSPASGSAAGDTSAGSAVGVKRTASGASAAATLTVAQKKLASTNIKGMKTMGAFFGAKPAPPA
jgi:hypothetical protein